MDYISNPNQRDVTIKKLSIGKDDKYARYRIDALQKAMSSLTPKAFQLWCYLGKNMDGFKLYLSKVDFLSWANVSDSSYRRAFQELTEMGYLIPRDADKTAPKHYDFYELPQEETAITIQIHKDGFVF